MDDNIEMELLSAVAFKDDILTQELAEHIDYTITIPDSLSALQQQKRDSFFLK